VGSEFNNNLEWEHSKLLEENAAIHESCIPHGYQILFLGLARSGISNSWLPYQETKALLNTLPLEALRAVHDHARPDNRVTFQAGTCTIEKPRSVFADKKFVDSYDNTIQIDVRKKDSTFSYIHFNPFRSTVRLERNKQTISLFLGCIDLIRCISKVEESTYIPTIVFMKTNLAMASLALKYMPFSLYELLGETGTNAASLFDSIKQGTKQVQSCSVYGFTTFDRLKNGSFQQSLEDKKRVLYKYLTKEKISVTVENYNALELKLRKQMMIEELSL
jgi:hypothetical protein